MSAAPARALAGPPHLILVAADKGGPEGRPVTVPIVEMGTPAWRRSLAGACWQLPRQQKGEQDPTPPPSGQTLRKRPGSSGKGFGHRPDAHVNSSSAEASHGRAHHRGLLAWGGGRACEAGFGGTHRSGLDRKNWHSSICHDDAQTARRVTRQPWVSASPAPSCSVPMVSGRRR